MRRIATLALTASVVATLGLSGCAAPAPSAGPDQNPTTTSSKNGDGPDKDPGLSPSTSPLPDWSQEDLWTVLGNVAATPAFVPKSLSELKKNSPKIVQATIVALRPYGTEEFSPELPPNRQPPPALYIDLLSTSGEKVTVVTSYPTVTTPGNSALTIPRNLPKDQYAWFLQDAGEGLFGCVNTYLCALTVTDGQITAPISGSQSMNITWPDTGDVKSLDDLSRP